MNGPVNSVQDDLTKELRTRYGDAEAPVVRSLLARQGRHPPYRDVFLQEDSERIADVGSESIARFCSGAPA